MSLLDGFSEKEIIRLQFITHKLALIASARVLHEYHSLLYTIKRISVDKSFSGDMPELHESLASLTLAIREDILGKNTDQDRGYTQSQVSEMIYTNTKENIKAIEGDHK